MELLFPPVANIDQLKREVSALPKSLREDAVQEAWSAHLAGGNAVAAVWAFAKREQRHKSRHIQIEQSEDGEPYAIDTDGSRQSFPAPQQSQSSATTDRRNSLRKAG